MKSLPKKEKITVVGKIGDVNFEKAKTCVLFLEQQNEHVTAEIISLFDTQWDEYIKRVAFEKEDPEFSAHRTAPLAFTNDTTYIGGIDQLLNWALLNYRYVDNTKLYKKKAAMLCKKVFNESVRKFAFLEILIQDEEKHTVIIELFNDIVPKTVENFFRLCIGNTKNNKGKQLTYTGTHVRRVIPGVFVEAGNLEDIGVSEHSSIYQGEFADEGFEVKHDSVGLVGMSKRSGYPHTNQCQFYVTLGAPLSFLDNKCVLFGRVIQGMRVFKVVERLETLNQKPLVEVTIAASGEYKYTPGK